MVGQEPAKLYYKPQGGVESQDKPLFCRPLTLVSAPGFEHVERQLEETWRCVEAESVKKGVKERKRESLHGIF